MKRNHVLLVIIAAIAALQPIPALADTNAAADSTAAARGVLVVQTDIDSALVLLDGRRAGVTPLEVDSVSVGTHLLRVLHPDVANWLTGSVSDTLRIGPAERVVRIYHIPREVSMNSTPSGAGIFLRDSLLGFTPLILPLDSTIGRSGLTISKPGYNSAVLRPNDVGRGFVQLSLSPKWPGESSEDRLLETSLRPGSGRTGLYLSGATAVLAGIATAYLKIQADDRQDRYTITGDPALLSQRNRFDRGAAATYVLTQISFGIFAYFLFSD
jgi:hypothetical protein